LRPTWEYSHEAPIAKITRAKWNGGVVQAAEHLLCKHEALSSNPNPTKKGAPTNIRFMASRVLHLVSLLNKGCQHIDKFIYNDQLLNKPFIYFFKLSVFFN
jgi:hypothetical protein